MTALRQRRLPRGERGASAVEAALTFPVFLLFFVAGCSLLWIVAARSALAQGARAGARFAALPESPFTCTTAPCPATYDTYPTEVEVAAVVADETPLLAVPASAVDVCRYRATTTPADFAAAGACLADADVGENDKVAVRVTHTVPDVFRPFAGIFGIGAQVRVTEGEARSE